MWDPSPPHDTAQAPHIHWVQIARIASDCMEVSEAPAHRRLQQTLTTGRVSLAVSSTPSPNEPESICNTPTKCAVFPVAGLHSG